MTLQEALPIVLPLLGLQLVLMAVGLWDLTRPDRRVRGGDKRVWAVVIVLGNLLGSLAYFLYGRLDD